MTKKKLLGTALTAAVVGTAITPGIAANAMVGEEVLKSLPGGETEAVTTSAEVTSTQVVLYPFKDVQEKHREGVNFLYSKGINGFNKDTFGPEKPITRAQAAIFIAIALDLDLEKQPAHGFKDVPKHADKHVRALKAAGYINGVNDETFGSYTNLTRGQIALIVSRIYDLNGDPSNNTFKDVKGSYATAVAGMYELGITNGINKETYGTHNAMKRGNFALFLYRLSKMNGHSAPATDGVKLINEKELEISFKKPITQVNPAGVSVLGYKMNSKTSSYTQTNISGKNNLDVSIKGDKLIVKALGDNVFKTGFDPDFEVTIKENTVTTLGTQLKNNEIKVEVIDEKLYEVVNGKETLLKMEDKAAPVILGAFTEANDTKIDLTFTEFISLDEKRDLAESFSVYNATNNAKAKEIEKVDDNRIILTFNKLVADEKIDLNKIRIDYKVGKTPIEDLKKNKLKDQTLTGAKKEKRKEIVNLDKLKDELYDEIRKAKREDTKNKTEASVKKLDDAIKKAEDVYNNDKSTASQINSAIKSLETAIKNLKDETKKPEVKPNEKPTEKPEEVKLAESLKALDALTKKASTVERYAGDTKEATDLKTVIHQAIDIYSDKNTTQKDIDLITKDLKSKVESIEKNVVPAFDKEIKTELEKLEKLNQKIKEIGNNTNDEDLEKLKNKIEEIKKNIDVYKNLNNSELDQDEIEEIENAIQIFEDELQKVQSELEALLGNNEDSKLMKEFNDQSKLVQKLQTNLKNLNNAIDKFKN